MRICDTTKSSVCLNALKLYQCRLLPLTQCYFVGFFKPFPAKQKYSFHLLISFAHASLRTRWHMVMVLEADRTLKSSPGVHVDFFVHFVHTNIPVLICQLQKTCNSLAVCVNKLCFDFFSIFVLQFITGYQRVIVISPKSFLRRSIVSKRSARCSTFGA